MRTIRQKISNISNPLITPGGGTKKEEEAGAGGCALQGVEIRGGLEENCAVTAYGEEIVGYLHGNEVRGQTAAKVVGVNVLTLCISSVTSEGESSWILWNSIGNF